MFHTPPQHAVDKPAGQYLHCPNPNTPTPQGALLDARDVLVADLVRSKAPAKPDWSEDFIRAQQALTRFHDIYINRVTPGAEQDFMAPLYEAYEHIERVIERLAPDEFGL